MNHTLNARINATTPAEQSPIEDYIENVAVKHLEAISALFSAILGLDDDHQTVGALASHGRYVAQMVSNELDCLRSDMESARTGAAAPTDAKPAKQ